MPDYELLAMRRLFLTVLRAPGGTAWWIAFKHVPPPVLVRYLDDYVEGDHAGDGAASGPFPWLKSGTV